MHVNNSHTERIMIISWKWKPFWKFPNDPNQPKMDAAFWNTSEGKEILDDAEIGLDKGLYDSFTVCEKDNKENPIEVHPPAKVVRLYVECCDKCLELIEKLAKYYESNNSKIFIFLHKSDAFSGRSIRHILQNTKVDKCFLIGSGKDYIYGSTQKEGLLGVNGRFHRLTAKPGKPAVNVADEKKKEIYQPHFDNVWDHYEHEFINKAYELKEDMLSHFLPFSEDRRPDEGELKDLLGKDPNLLLRAKSFVEQLTKEEQELLGEYEIKKQKSYIFDDFTNNIKRMTGKDLNEYKQAKKEVEFFLSDDKGREKETIRERLWKLQKEMNELIVVLKKH